jgi:hypothetical protein
MKSRSFWRRLIPDWRRPDALRIALVLAAAATLGLGASALHLPVVEAQAGHIDSISTSCASVGAQVTITGQGFGAHNVAIAVGGVSAEVVSANGHSATFIVPAGVHLGPTTVTATNPGGHTGSIAFKVCDLLVPEAWGGEWKMAITYSTANGLFTATDDITAFIRTNEPFGLSPVAIVGSCAGSVSETHMEIQCTGQATSATCTLGGSSVQFTGGPCSGQATSGSCTIGTSAQITADRAGDTINGSGMNTTAFTGNCGPLVNSVQNIQISGRRLSLNQDPFGPPTTLVKSFVPFAAHIGAGQ